MSFPLLDNLAAPDSQNASQVLPEATADRDPTPYHFALGRAPGETNAGSGFAARLVSRRLENEQHVREAGKPSRSNRTAWMEHTLVPALEAMAGSLRAASAPALVERSSPWLVRLRIGDVRRGDIERWVEVNAYPNPVCVTARVDRLARVFPACDTFPDEPGGPGRDDVMAWLETLVAQMFA